MPPASKKRKIGSTAPAEITFDFAAREEYLTGFHKRKQARIKHAQEEAVKKDNEERLRLRREMRALRKEQLEEHVSGINALLRKANGDVGEDGDTDDAEDGTDEDEFSGFDGPQPEEVDREDEYIDEDKYTTVTIESVGISKEGFEKAGGGDEDAGEGKDKGSGQDKHGKKTKRVWTKEWPKSDRPKKRKVKFRYENKADRKATRMKQDAKKRAQASARKGE